MIQSRREFNLVFFYNSATVQRQTKASDKKSKGSGVINEHNKSTVDTNT